MAKGAGVSYVDVAADRGGQRVDNFLLGMLAGVPRSWVYRVLRTGQVRVNGGRVRAERRLEPGDRIRVPPVTSAQKPAVSKVPQALAQRLNQSVLFKDDDLIVIDKPSGLAVHGGSGQSLGLIEALRQLWPANDYLELVHRLDKETSGCLMLARSRAALRAMHAGLREGQVHKHYIALVMGRWASERRMTGDLQRSQDSSGERRVRVVESGKASATLFKPLRPGIEASLVDAYPETGRTHQIRVHAAAAGHPLAGDDKYGRREFDRLMRGAGLKRLFLHAAGLEFQHPTSGARVKVEADLPIELAQVVESLDLPPPSKSRSARGRSRRLPGGPRRK